MMPGKLAVVQRVHFGLFGSLETPIPNSDTEDN